VVNRSVVVGAFMLALVGTRARADAPKRQIPNYDGRGSEPTTAGDAALWIPRALLLPPYIVSEYVIRRPLGALIAGAERAGVAATAPDSTPPTCRQPSTLTQPNGCHIV